MNDIPAGLDSGCVACCCWWFSGRLRASAGLGYVDIVLAQPLSVTHQLDHLLTLSSAVTGVL